MLANQIGFPYFAQFGSVTIQVSRVKYVMCGADKATIAFDDGEELDLLTPEAVLAVRVYFQNQAKSSEPGLAKTAGMTQASMSRPEPP